MACPTCSAKPLSELIGDDGRIHACANYLRGFRKLKETYRSLVIAGVPERLADRLMVELGRERERRAN